MTELMTDIPKPLRLSHRAKEHKDLRLLRDYTITYTILLMCVAISFCTVVGCIAFFNWAMTVGP